MAIKTDFLHEIDRFRLVLKKRVSSKYAGSHASDQAGGGLTFKDFREYVPGDDFRNIDWRVFARLEKFYIRRFEEERNFTVEILVDASASMNFGEGVTKFEYASMLGLGFAYMALKNNEKFNFSTFADNIRPFKAKKGMSHLLNMVEYLNGLKIDGQSDFKQCMESFKKTIRSKSMIIMISDFLVEPDVVKEALMRYKQSQVIAIQVLDPIEKSLAIEGDNILEDLESQKHLRTYISRRVRSHYQDKLSMHIAELNSIFEGMNATFVSCTTDNPVFDSFYQCMQ